MGTRTRLRKVFTIAVLLTACGSSAQAFYFRGWPGDGVPKPPTIIKPTAPPEDNPPSGRPRPPTPPVDTPRGPTGGENPPSGTPEPGTLALAAIGLGALVLRQRRKGAKVANIATF
jgi:hypothetical protein